MKVNQWTTVLKELVEELRWFLNSKNHHINKTKEAWHSFCPWNSSDQELKSSDQAQFMPIENLDPGRKRFNRWYISDSALLTPVFVTSCQLMAAKDDYARNAFVFEDFHLLISVVCCRWSASSEHGNQIQNSILIAQATPFAERGRVWSRCNRVFATAETCCDQWDPRAL